MCIIILKIQILKLSNPIKALGVLHLGVTNSRDYRTHAGTTKKQSGPSAVVKSHEASCTSMVIRNFIYLSPERSINANPSEEASALRTRV